MELTDAEKTKVINDVKRERNHCAYWGRISRARERLRDLKIEWKNTVAEIAGIADPTSEYAKELFLRETKLQEEIMYANKEYKTKRDRGKITNETNVSV